MLVRVEVVVVGEIERAGLVGHWVGGTVAKHAFSRPVRRFKQLEHFDKLLARIIDLRSHGATAQIIADALNTEGWTPPKKDSFNAPMINSLLQRRGLGTKRPIWSNNIPRRHKSEMTLQEYADRTGAHCLRRGRIRGRLASGGTQRIWLIDLQNSSIGIYTGESS
ncbi:hypothetical protein [Sphingobium lactosutens]|uniref:hypothetical protein n=1 Tax=Sphingobium lactosutens TaxID=522773 RepID=UPI002117787B|nr:hypothetical protein [Sphingobium lactosutens]